MLRCCCGSFDFDVFISTLLQLTKFSFHYEKISSPDSQRALIDGYESFWHNVHGRNVVRQLWTRRFNVNSLQIAESKARRLANALMSVGADARYPRVAWARYHHSFRPPPHTHRTDMGKNQSKFTFFEKKTAKVCFRSEWDRASMCCVVELKRWKTWPEHDSQTVASFVRVGETVPRPTSKHAVKWHIS